MSASRAADKQVRERRPIVRPDVQHVPAVAFAMVGATGDMDFGLWFPVSVAPATFVIGAVFIRQSSTVYRDA